jgi:pyrrolidone-carboxylate peptidase
MADQHVTTQGDESPVHFFVTGFGKFGRVKVNPTTVIAKTLAKFVEDAKAFVTFPGFSLHSCTVLETSAEGSRETLEKLYAEAEQLEGTVLFLHLGLDAGIKHFYLEPRAYNEAHFPCEDERGYLPKHLPIVESAGDTTHFLQSSLPTELLRDSLLAGRVPVKVSTQPDRFVCNWVHYLSLTACQERGQKMKAVYMHVPPFHRIDHIRQLECVVSLMQEIGVQLGRRPSTLDGLPPWKVWWGGVPMVSSSEEEDDEEE